MRRIIIRGLVSGKTPLTPEVLKVLKELASGKLRPSTRTVLHNTDEPPPASSIPKSAQTGRRGCGSQRLIFVSVLPGRWVRCTGAMVACPSPVVTNSGAGELKSEASKVALASKPSITNPIS